MTQTPLEALERLKKYIAERKRLRGTEVNIIHGLHHGEDKETTLYLSDIEAIIQALTASAEPVGWYYMNGYNNQRQMTMNPALSEKRRSEGVVLHPLYASPQTPTPYMQVVDAEASARAMQSLAVLVSLLKEGHPEYREHYERVRDHIHTQTPCPAPNREAVAKAIYAVMRRKAGVLTKNGVEYPPEWVEGGNSLKQEEARDYADAVLANADFLRGME